MKIENKLVWAKPHSIHFEFVGIIETQKTNIQAGWAPKNVIEAPKTVNWAPRNPASSSSQVCAYIRGPQIVGTGP